MTSYLNALLRSQTGQTGLAEPIRRSRFEEEPAALLTEPQTELGDQPLPVQPTGGPPPTTQGMPVSAALMPPAEAKAADLPRDQAAAEKAEDSDAPLPTPTEARPSGVVPVAVAPPQRQKDLQPDPVQVTWLDHGPLPVAVPVLIPMSVTEPVAAFASEQAAPTEADAAPAMQMAQAELVDRVMPQALPQQVHFAMPEPGLPNDTPPPPEPVVIEIGNLDIRLILPGKAEPTGRRAETRHGPAIALNDWLAGQVAR